MNVDLLQNYRIILGLYGIGQYVIIQRLILVSVILRQEIRSRRSRFWPRSPALMFSEYGPMFIYEMLQTHENVNVGDFNRVIV
jgi:hypothetical protein